MPYHAVKASAYDLLILLNFYGPGAFLYMMIPAKNMGMNSIAMSISF